VEKISRISFYILHIKNGKKNYNPAKQEARVHEIVHSHSPFHLKIHKFGIDEEI